MLKKLWKSFLDIIFPINCVSCGKFDYYLCPDCQKELKFLKKFSELNNGFQFYSFFDYKKTDISKLIHLFKYKYVEDIFKLIEGLFLENKENFKKEIIFLKKIYYLPVPLHIRRERERGYNQSERLTEIFQKIWPGKILNNIISRKKYTKAQAKLNKEERLLNLKDKFILNLDNLNMLDQNAIVIIVDDVVTTGSTLLEIKKLLSFHYKGEIMAMVLARDFKEF
jgi:competence protein ComFC